MEARGSLRRQVALRLTEEDVARLDELTRRIGIASRNSVARAALRMGLSALEGDPTRALASAAKPTKGKRHATT